MPQPVGPIIRMFLGSTSSRIGPVELLAAPAVAQRDGDGALGVVLADDVAVELGDDLAGRKGGHDWILRPAGANAECAPVQAVSSDSMVRLSLV